MIPSDSVLIEMWGPAQEMFIAEHEFFWAQAKIRLLDQFSIASMESEARRRADEWLEEQAGEDDPDCVHERAIEIEIDFFQSLVDLCQATRLSVIASMFHKWEKQLRDWLTIEFDNHGFGEAVHSAIWKASLDQLLDLFANCGWSVRERPYWNDLELCRMVTNVYKHGRGPSFDRLRVLAPHVLGNDGDGQVHVLAFLDYATLTVTDEELSRFATAITDFWRDVPESICFSLSRGVPDWLRNALSRR